jgi:hypothetical protein
VPNQIKHFGEEKPRGGVVGGAGGGGKVIATVPISSSSSSNSTRIQSENASIKILKDFEDNDDEDIVVVDGEFDLEKAESHSENEIYENEASYFHDDDDDVEYGQNRVTSANTVVTLISNDSNNDNAAAAAKPRNSESELEENSLEISTLEKFK